MAARQHAHCQDKEMCIDHVSVLYEATQAYPTGEAWRPLENSICTQNSGISTESHVIYKKLNNAFKVKILKKLSGYITFLLNMLKVCISNVYFQHLQQKCMTVTDSMH